MANGIIFDCEFESDECWIEGAEVGIGASNSTCRSLSLEAGNPDTPRLSVEARRVRPGLRVLLTSGYTGTALDDGSVPADLPLLSKPYQREDLANKLRIVLGRIETAASGGL